MDRPVEIIHRPSLVSSRLLRIKPQALYASRAIRVGQLVRILWNAVETQEKSQRLPLIEAVAGPLTGLLIVPYSIAHAADRDKYDLIDDVHVLPSYRLLDNQLDNQLEFPSSDVPVTT